MYKVGIIGCGRIGFLLENDPLRIKPCTHIGGILTNKKLRITAACDINRLRLSHFARIHHIHHLYTDHRKMLATEDLDIVVISTWTDSHRSICCEAAPTARLIVCEKPMAFHSPDCFDMIKACRRHKTFLLINHERRYSPLYRKAKEMIMDGKIGRVHTVIANVLTAGSSKKSFKIDSSSLLHDGTHLIDISLFLFGPVKEVKGYISPSRRDTSFGLIQFKNGILLFMEAGGYRNYFNFELDIQGSSGRIRVGNEYMEIFTRKKSHRYTGFYELEKKAFPKIANKNEFIEEYQEVSDLLEGKIKKPTSAGEDGMKTIEIIEAISRNKLFQPD
ncbi:MAG: Gfo/Idh/MocA family oxidoreductase [Spirochaetes bacterium]|nr:Gfo/Idh/MocA family oxidoreductase [Spirochaetota bacterium]